MACPGKSLLHLILYNGLSEQRSRSPSESSHQKFLMSVQQLSFHAVLQRPGLGLSMHKVKINNNKKRTHHQVHVETKDRANWRTATANFHVERAYDGDDDEKGHTAHISHWYRDVVTSSDCLRIVLTETKKIKGLTLIAVKIQFCQQKLFA